MMVREVELEQKANGGYGLKDKALSGCCPALSWRVDGRGQEGKARPSVNAWPSGAENIGGYKHPVTRVHWQEPYPMYLPTCLSGRAPQVLLWFRVACEEGRRSETGQPPSQAGDKRHATYHMTHAIVGACVAIWAEHWNFCTPPFYINKPRPPILNQTPVGTDIHLLNSYAAGRLGSVVQNNLFNLAKNHHHEGPSCGCHDAVMT